MNIASRQEFWNTYTDFSKYCIVNDNATTYIETDFMLGDNMTLEVCFKRTHDKSSDTGVVLVGHHNL